MSHYTRRDFLRLLGLAAGSVALGACADRQSGLMANALPSRAPSPDTINALTLPLANFRALNRLCYGPTVEERRFVHTHGVRAWIEAQLDYDNIDDMETSVRLSPLDSLKMSASDIRDSYASLFDTIDKEAAIAVLRQGTLLKQIYSHRQLYEMMVEFWSDHFNIYIDKGDGWFLKTVDDREAVRPHALGNFRDLLSASVHSPAMLTYLDNQANRAGTPNENYARELMELHTLGVHGGYQQSDVQALARCLTGWGVNMDSLLHMGEFAFDESQHDAQPKTVLGIHLQPDRVREAERVIEQFATHPKTAEFIATKLARRFIADDPPSAAITRAAQVFVRSQGDIRATLRALLLDEDEQSWATRAAKLKRPSQFVVSAIRQTGATCDGGLGLQVALRQMGQNLFGWPTPDGYPDRTNAWQHNLLPRWQFALALAYNQVDGLWINPENINVLAQAEHINALCKWLFGMALPTPVMTQIQSTTTEPRTILAALLCAPEFQWR